MGDVVQRTVVISAVNIRKGGTLTILRDCLAYLSSEAVDGRFRVIAFVHDRSLCDFPGIEYIEIPDSIKSWRRRLRCEYKTMRWHSRLISEQDDRPVSLWFSLHDTTPDVIAERRAVYCHTSFPWLKTTLRDWWMDYKIPMFAHFTKYAYRKNVQKNDYLVVQQDWMRKALSSLVKFDPARVVVFPPAHPTIPQEREPVSKRSYTFLYPATPDCHKNFEYVCEAARLLELEIGRGRFKVELTIRGEENKYAWWLKNTWGGVDSVHFAGFMSKAKLWSWYDTADCLIFPSRVETWGLPISEFATTGKPMLLADRPYAHETAAGSSRVAFFPLNNVHYLKEQMKALVQGSESNLSFAPYKQFADPVAFDWKSLFKILLGDE